MLFLVYNGYVFKQIHGFTYISPLFLKAEYNPILSVVIHSHKH